MKHPMLRCVPEHGQHLHRSLSCLIHLSVCEPVLFFPNVFVSQACGFVKSASPGKRERRFYTKRQHKSNGATMHHWDGPRTGKDLPLANVIPVERCSETSCVWAKANTVLSPEWLLFSLHFSSLPSLSMSKRTLVWHRVTVLTILPSPSAGRGGLSRSSVGVVGGSARPQPTHPPAPPAKVTPVTTGCFFPCGRTTACHRAACASTTRPRASSTPSQSSSHLRLRAARRARRWWTTRSSAASVRKPVAREKEMTGGVRVSFVFLLLQTDLHYCWRISFSL